ncbi:hypothetical protein K523DRAFT_156821 [Schizophyllum commune Tattone D]|nr:hypothetical protein K523DRAFT_156821 [Schizophyllum commune Tattone D]
MAPMMLDAGEVRSRRTEMSYNGAQEDEARGDAGGGLCCALRRGWWRHTSAGGQCGLNRNKRASLRHLRGKTMAAVNSRGIVHSQCPAAQHTSERWTRGRHVEVRLRAARGSGLNPSESRGDGESLQSRRPCLSRDSCHFKAETFIHSSPIPKHWHCDR